MKRFPVYFLLFLGLYFCKKKDVPNDTDKPGVTATVIPIDTLLPGSYFPAYPGSYWNYVDDKNASVSHTTGPVYVLDSIPNYNSIYTATSVTKAYVPTYDGVKIWGLSEHVSYQNWVSHSSIIYQQGLRMIVPDTMPVGYQWMIEPRRYNSTYADNGTIAKIIAKDTTIQILGTNYYPTIVVYCWSWYCESSSSCNQPAIYANWRKYYTKNIGLIKMETLQGSTTSFSVTGEYHLLNYHINM